MGEDKSTTAVSSGEAATTEASAETTAAPAEAVEAKKKAVEDNAPNSSASNSASNNNTTDEADGEKDDKDDVTQKEASLKDRLSRKAEESRLKNKLIAKKRLSSTSDHSAGSSSDTKKKAPSSTTANGSHRATSSSRSPTSRRRSRSKSKSRDRSRSSARRSSSPYYHPHHPQRRRGGGGGPPPHNPYPHGGGPWGGYPRDDPYGRRYHHHHPGGGGGGYGPPPGGPPYHPPPHAAAYHYRGDDHDDQDPFGRAPRRHYRSGSRRRSSSRSRSLSRSPPDDNDDHDHDSRGSSKRGRGHDDDRRRSKQARRHGSSRHGSSHRRDRRRSPSSSGSSVSSSASSTSSSGSSDSDSDHDDHNNNNVNNNNGAFDKDTRTVFVNQLVLRTTSHDLRHYFRKTVGAKVQEVSLLRDKRTGKHKGCAYMELRTMADVNKALAVSGQTPDWQRFPILVKPSEAEKNYVVPVRTTATATATAAIPTSTTTTPPLPPLMGPNGLPMEAQKVYVGSLDPRITEEHLYQIFQHFGILQKVHLQRDPGTGLSKGFAFLKFRDPRDANLALQTMAGQVLVGRPMKTGWASHVVGSAPGVQVLTSDEFLEDASEKAQKGLVALTQLAINGGGSAVVMGAPSSTAVAQLADAALQAALGGTGAVPSTTTTGRTATVSKIPTVAEARQIMAAGTGVAVPTTTAPAVPAPPDATVIGRAERPSPHLLVHNMYDKDEETEAGWAEEIRVEFMEECSQYGQLDRVVVLSQEVGGKIYASFASTTAAQKCAASLAGRWFDKRQLRVEFVDDTEIPPAPPA